MSTTSAFFYGTLLHPAILRRVIGHHGDELTLCSAVLLEHTRHKVKVTSHRYRYGDIEDESRELLQGKDLSPEQRTVRGTVVSGLSDTDIELLDTFEGNEYSREVVPVHPLSSFVPLSASETPDSAIVPTTPPPLPPPSSLPEPILAQTYIWIRPLSELEPELWEYAEFVRTNAWKWVGQSGSDEHYAEVEKRKEMKGTIVRTEIVTDVNGEEKVITERTPA